MPDSVYRLSTEADGDLVRIYIDGVERFGPARADAYHARLFEAFDRIAANPNIAAKRMELRPPIHALPVGSHIVLYVADGAAVLILRVAHQREDWLTK